MGNISRRNFIQYSSGLLTFAAADLASIDKKRGPLLAFSTLGCPDWSLQQIIDFAVKHGFKGIEIRGVQRQLDLSKSPHFNTPEALTDTRKRIKDSGLKIVGLGSSAAMHHSVEADRDKAFDEAKRFIDIAAKVDCPYVRVFPDKLAKDRDKAEVLDVIATNLTSLADAAKGSGVSVLMETHGDVVRAADLETVMNKVGDHANAGLVWDISNMWSVTGEAPSVVYPKLKKWIRHTHLKDLKKVEGKDQYTLMAEGEVPVFEAVSLLRKGGYKGYYSFEWEKLWHPEIAEPEVAIAQYAQKMKEGWR
jgi:sugar phosphate isomerase/epimerase